MVGEVGSRRRLNIWRSGHATRPALCTRSLFRVAPILIYFFAKASFALHDFQPDVPPDQPQTVSVVEQIVGDGYSHFLGQGNKIKYILNIKIIFDNLL